MGWIGNLLPANANASATAGAIAAAVPTFAASTLQVRALNAGVVNPAVGTVTSGALDAQFGPLIGSSIRKTSGVYWLRLQSKQLVMPTGIPVVVVHGSRQSQVDLFAARGDAAVYVAKRLGRNQVQMAGPLAA